MIRRLSILLACAAALTATLPTSSALAGTYEVTACFNDRVNRSWEEFRHDGFAITYVDCTERADRRIEPGMVARSTQGPGLAPGFAHARMYFTAPPGARIIAVRGDTKQNGTGGWASGIHDETNNVWLSCCTTLLTWQPFNIALSTQRVAALTICASGGGCARDGAHGYSALRNVTVTIADDGPPNVAIAGGSLVAGGWRRGVQDVAVDASDPVGIRQTRASIDGAVKREFDRPCDPKLRAPCPNGRDALSVDTRSLADGRHLLTVHAIDTAGNVRAVSRHVAIDNNAPNSPQALGVVGGDAWKGRNEFQLGWRNPRERQAPVQGAVVAVCPAAQRPIDPLTCPRRFHATSTGETKPFPVPGRGQWRAHVWLRDAAGNEDSTYAAEAILRYDDVPPTVAIRAQSPDRPAVVRVLARDGLSPLIIREVLVRRRGHAAWITLPVTPERDGFSAFVDDERLPRGIYDVRARAVDQAGNERTTDRRQDGTLARLALPLRIRTRLEVGRPKRVRVRGAGGKRGYRIVLVERPRSRYGRTIPLRGRLTSPGGNPLAGRDVEVSEQTRVPGAAWRPIATLRTSRTGRFTFRAMRGPSRTLRFRFGGSDTIRGRTTLVRLGVRASTTLNVSRARVVNGEGVTFRGRVKGRPIPEAGKLVELQARTRGGWRTFATMRARVRTGRWSYAYRFSATRGTVRYRFRARVPKENAFPYETGSSRAVTVRVQGL